MTMISIQSFICKDLDRQGVLPDKWTDLALKPSHPSYYNKVYQNGVEYNGNIATSFVDILVPSTSKEPVFDLTEPIDISCIIPKVQNEVYLFIYNVSDTYVMNLNSMDTFVGGYIKSRVITGSNNSIKKQTAYKTKGKRMGVRFAFDPSTKKWTSYYSVNDGNWISHYTFSAASSGPRFFRIQHTDQEVDLTLLKVTRGNEVIFSR